MFTEIDLAGWDRKEIYEQFYGCMYYITAEIEITALVEALRARGVKFYPAVCHCIAHVVNGERDFRLARVGGKVGCWPLVHPHYTLMRGDGSNLFTQKITRYDPDFDTFYRAFEADRLAAENGNVFNYDGPCPLDMVHISILPHTSQKALSFSKPASFTGYDGDTVSFVPFVIVGRYYEQNGTLRLPVTGEFHHAVNDGYHAELFFTRLEERCRALAAELRG